MIASLLLVGASGAWVTSQIALQSPISSGPDCFLIDNSHLPAIGHYEARVNPAGPLETNLLRCGLRVAHLERWDRAKIAGSRGIAFVAPQRPFGGGEVRDLLRFEEEGGIVLVAAGRPDAAACGAILEAHDLALANRPLGSVPDNAGQGRQTPHFLDAWPIVDLSGGNLTEAPGTEVLYRSGGDVLALYRGRGRGGLILVADTRFFSSMNVEDQTDVWLGNLAFIHDLFIKYLRVDPGSVSPAFASPKKPE